MAPHRRSKQNVRWRAPWRVQGLPYLRPGTCSLDSGVASCILRQLPKYCRHSTPEYLSTCSPHLRPVESYLEGPDPRGSRRAARVKVPEPSRGAEEDGWFAQLYGRALGPTG